MHFVYLCAMIPFSKNIAKGIRALEQRKHRRAEGLFVAEGNKLVEDCLGLRGGHPDASLRPMACRRLVATQAWWDAHAAALGAAPALLADAECHAVTPDELERASLMQSPQDVIGVFCIPQYSLDRDALPHQLTLVLDDVQDPGNVGTIIRLCDWFGIRDIIASPATADCFAPKVVQATMGAIARVRVHYINITTLLEKVSAATGAALPHSAAPILPIYGTYLEGENLYETELSHTGLIIMGNEGRGISPRLAPYVTRKLNIPSYPAGIPTGESLNVGIATAITVAEFRRRQLLQP